ncbi:hypothetical protein QV08_08115 [Gallibacterium salpingitidis]|uniref:HTH lysR-type domain-containing protein n=1 Tax=Gallibacterium salpingitidis TaxID=505341 RepID=A0A1A7QDS3_9PAST|nr:LysR family transcriptional regulator [Gallibacterium salpingitidis]OBW94960.1 hypothetical protein QS62_04730 [Gallibacterium salpingitidis]OBX07159.1 hypothetical protein QV08_08115 [Gallibacterium salpingitidis]OBX12127.1 hypothetical protein QV09_00195 [Gallibacterium salpingitidis]WKS99819.1 LysR family transcriptional regulator [Gallibacterium salpingitidis]
MDLKQLAYFAKVAELNSYTRAADELDIAQPLLSRHIRQLETELGKSLLVRNGRGVTTTEAGQILLRHCHQILNQVQLLKEDLSFTTGKITGSISLGIPPTLSKLLARDIIKLFYQRLPEANLIVTEGLTRDLQERLSMDRLHVALLHNPIFLKNLEYELLINVQLMLIVRRDNPEFIHKTSITAADLETIPLVIPSKNNTYRQLFDTEMAKLHRKSNIIMEVDSKELILDLVEDGIGNSILLPMTLAFRDYHNNLRAIPITEPELPCDLYMAISSKTNASRLQLELMKIIREVLEQHFPEKNKK